MNSSFSKLSIALLLLLFQFNSFSQTPVLTVNSTDNTEKQAVTLHTMDIDVQVAGTIATTVITMVFANSSDRILEGTLVFPLPEGTTVSRYAIDINGRLREAVPVEKNKGTEVFETIEHRRVDPGLLEKVEGNNFRTRIYPIPARGKRTVLIAYEEELKPNEKMALRYHLPLDYATAIPDFHLKTTVFNSSVKPVLEEQPDGSFSFSNAGNIYMAEMTKTNFLPPHSLTINLPKNTSIPEVLVQPAGNSYYFLVNTYPKAESHIHTWKDRIGIIWDVSLSGLKRDINKELELLDKIIASKKNCTIQLGLLNNRFVSAGSYSISNGNWIQLKEKLQQLVYDGGTDFNAINQNTLNAEEYILFSDGLSTFGKDSVKLTRPVQCISSAVSPDYSLLKNICLKSGGQFVNLSNTSPEEAVSQLSHQALRFIGIKNDDRISEVYPSDNIAASNYLSVAGITDQYDIDITLQFGCGNEVSSEKKIRLKGKTSGNVARVWAQKKIAAMDVEYEKNKEDISTLGKQFGIVTRNTSLIVLESVEDYIRYDIFPPAELRQEYDRLVKEQLLQKENRVNDLLDRGLGMTAELREWWKTVFMPRKKYPVPSTSNQGTVTERYSEVVVVSAPVAERRLPPANNYYDTEKDEDKATTAYKSASGNVVSGLLQGRVSGLSIRADSTSIPSSGYTNNWSSPVTIELPEDFRNDHVYMKKFTPGLSVASAYNIYLSLRKEYLNTPLYYYDVAGWFFKNNSKDTALMILSGIADLGMEDAELYKLLAYKLKQTGYYEEEIFISGKVLQWRPMDPQSYRDYGLALADGGYYQQALDTIYSIFTKSYAEGTASRDQGIEEILVTEINHLISMHKDKLDISRIDKKMIFPMPVDVRVVINWNKNDTDIDLWVTDPHGEKCYYGNSRSAIGGRISDDFTQGFGPEQFMLKKATKGKYKIEVNYYGERQLSLTGAATVMAEIYTRYSNGEEQRKIIALQMPSSNKEGVLIGSFTF